MSIPSQPPAIRIPDFRNLGVWLRILLAANGIMVMAAITANHSLSELLRETSELAALVEPVLLLLLSILFVLTPMLRRLPVRTAMLLVVAMTLLLTLAIDSLLAHLLDSEPSWRAPPAMALAAMILLYWHTLRAQAQAPAIVEARLAALTARIRPHFLFNSLNTVLAILREEPRQAEQALEGLAELFRASMSDNRELVLLSDEIELARRYLEIEKLRLGQRLQVNWQIGQCPPDLLAPPLLLQPLVENAVYHGIEPAATAGDVAVRISSNKDGVRIEVENPLLSEAPHRSGNRMALVNLRERLMLFYDLEASLESKVKDGRYRVVVKLPKRNSQ